MTREEAIQHLENLKISHPFADVSEWVDMAIEALTLQNLTKPNNTCEVDLISRADAIDVLQQFAEDEKPNDEMSEQFQQYQRGRHLAFLQAVEEIKALPSTDAESDDIIIKGAKGIQDGLYNIKDGKLFKYKGKGGTVRTYPIVPSADAVSREFYEDAVKANIGLVIKNRELKEQIESAEAVPQLKQTDTLIIADALRYLAKDTERHLVDRTRADALRQQFLKYGASMCKGGEE